MPDRAKEREVGEANDVLLVIDGEPLWFPGDKLKEINEKIKEIKLEMIREVIKDQSE